jgi:hypothetical protein
MFTADWALAFVGALEKSVRQACPQLLRSWPLLQSFNFDAYELPQNYMLLVLHDKLGGIPAGPGVPNAFPHFDHPAIPPAVEDIPLWQFYIRQTLDLAPPDVAFLVPMHDSGKSDAGADYALFSAQEKFYWHEQFARIFSEQKQWLESIMTSATPNVTTYNVSGPNSRVNVGSTDNSTNVVSTDNSELFLQLRQLLATLPDEAKRTAIAPIVEEMEQSAGKPSFTQHYTRFIALAADHVGLFSALLPALTSLLGA